jgi:MoaA/NifB/PqqE/SkfB family radical SAM enzyme
MRDGEAVVEQGLPGTAPAESRPRGRPSGTPGGPGPRAGRRPAGPPPPVAFRELRTLWFQITGTLCNLACRHCLNASGPKDPWLRGLDPGEVRRHIREAEALGVREFYFTGGEPFLHPELPALLADALAVAPTTVLTNGTLIDDAMADRLAALAAGSPYSLELRVSLDGATAEENDPIRGHGTFERALSAIQRLAARGLIPIVTATELAAGGPGGGLYDRLRALLLASGVTRPRIKIMPVFDLGRRADHDRGRRLTPELLEGYDASQLQCTETRVVADGGIYACPILAGLSSARVGRGRLADALGPVALGHPACYTCYETGMTCANS